MTRSIRIRRSPIEVLWTLPILASLALSACGGGGGGSSAPQLLSPVLLATQNPLTEGTAASLTVVLAQDADPLADTVVVVTDTLAGTAESGVDYVALQPVLVTFPAGSPAGTESTFPVQLLDDGAIEIEDETILLRLERPNLDGSFTLLTSATVAIQDDDRAEARFAKSSSTHSEESAASFDVAVVLVLDPGEFLIEPLTVALENTGQGSAIPGVDFTIDVASVTFDPGGALTQNLSFTIRDDAAVEGTEGFSFTLITDDGFEPFAGEPYAFGITETDIATAATLTVFDETDLPLGSGAQLEFGAVSLGGSSEMDLSLRNVGQVSMDLSTMTLTGDVRDFRIEILDAITLPLLASEPGTQAAQDADGRAHPELRVAFEASLDSSQLPRGAAFRLAGISLGDGAGDAFGPAASSLESLTLELTPLPLPFAPDALIVIDGVPLDVAPDVWLADVGLWTGRIAGAANSRVFLAASEAGLSGWIELDGVQTHIVTTEGDDGVRRTEFIADRELRADAASAPAGCAGALLPDLAQLSAFTRPGPHVPRTQVSDDGGTEAFLGLGYTPTTVRLALETDTAFTELFGSFGASGAYVSGLVAAVADRFRGELQVNLEIAYLGLYSGPDPWGSETPGLIAEDLLFEFQDAWNQDGWPVVADLAHFLSGNDLGGGVAYQSSLCVAGFEYGVSTALNGNLDWVNFSGTRSVFNWDFVVFAHELGHGLSAQHTHEVCPPLDRCGLSCEGMQCGTGTLMSVCLQCPGGVGNMELTFHSYNANSMRTRVSGSCLETGALPGSIDLGFRVIFAPTSDAGAKSVVLRFRHDSAVAPSPFVLVFGATAE